MDAAGLRQNVFVVFGPRTLQFCLFGIFFTVPNSIIMLRSAAICKTNVDASNVNRKTDTNLLFTVSYSLTIRFVTSRKMAAVSMK